MNDALLACCNVSKQYDEDAAPVKVLHDVSFTVQASEQIAILGSSGSGKSTLLHILGALDKPTSGEVLFKHQNIFDFNEQQRADFRNKSLGFVYQFHHLLPEFSALENAAMPLLIGNVAPDEAKQRASQVLERVGLGHRLDHRPSQLSGGERQRVAIARAIVNEPAIVLADEPTGNLDHKTGEGIFQLLGELKEQLNTAFVVVTHDNQLAARLDRILSITDGELRASQ